MGLSNHHRALVSNLGEGNWGVDSGTQNRVDSTNARIYFPPALDSSGSQVKGTEPTPGSSDAGPMSEFGFSGWGTKSNWIVQVVFTTLGTPPSSATAVAFTVNAVRPTGVKEPVIQLTGTDAGGDLNGASDGFTVTHGGFDGEKICGPVSYFEFVTAYTAGSPQIDCFVIGWNEGDMCYGLAG